MVGYKGGTNSHTYRDRYLYRGGTLTRADRIGQTDLAVPDLVVPVDRKC